MAHLAPTSLRMLGSALTFFLAGTPAFAQASFEILPLSPAFGSPPGEVLLDLSADGQVVAGHTRNNPFADAGPAALWDTESGISELPWPNGELPFFSAEAYALGISADGMVAVGSVTELSGLDSPTIWQADGSVTSITSGLVSGNARAVDVSGDGQIVLGQDSPITGDSLGGFVWDATNGTRGLKDLTGYTGTLVAAAISDDGSTATGFVSDGSFGPTEAFRWTEGGDLDLLGFVSGDDQSRANAISGDGSTIVGWSALTSEASIEAFRWTAAGGMQGLGQVEYSEPESPGSPFPPTIRTSTETIAFGASEDGSVIVGGGTTAWIHSDEYGGMIAVRDLLLQLGVAGLDGWEFFEAVDVSADGRVITGWAGNPEMGFGDFAWRAVIPEPSAALLIGLGLAALARGRE